MSLAPFDPLRGFTRPKVSIADETQCYNCRDAPCIDVCPTEALHYSNSDTVRVDAGRCIGCHYCGVGCSFGAPQYPDGEVPEAGESHPMGGQEQRLDGQVYNL